MRFSNKLLVSIVMPAYRSATTLELAVRSIMAQDYLHWELLLLLDSAEPHEMALAATLAAEDARIRLVVSKVNRGVVRMRNLGTRLAKGQWLAFCDADDYWIPEKLSIQLKFAHDRQLHLVCSSFWFWYTAAAAESWREVKLPAQLDATSMLKTNGIPMSTAMYHLASIGRQYFSPMPAALIHEDYDFWLKIMLQPGTKAYCVPQPTAMIRVQPQSRSANKWLALQSHGYILKNRAGLKGLSWYWAMAHYVVWGLKKRWSGKSLQTNPVAHA